MFLLQSNDKLRRGPLLSLSFDCSKNTGRWIASLFPNFLEACFNLSALSYLWNAVAPYSTFRLRSLCVNGCLPRSSCVNGCLPNTLLTCQDVPGSFFVGSKVIRLRWARGRGEPGNEATWTYIFTAVDGALSSQALVLLCLEYI